MEGNTSIYTQYIDTRGKHLQFVYQFLDFEGMQINIYAISENRNKSIINTVEVDRNQNFDIWRHYNAEMPEGVYRILIESVTDHPLHHLAIDDFVIRPINTIKTG